MYYLVVQAFAYACGGFKRKKFEKEVARSTKWQKKLEFLFKTCFSDKPFLVYKKDVYFSESIFLGITGNILEEYVDLIVTHDSADHFASRNYRRFQTSYHSKDLFLW